MKNQVVDHMVGELNRLFKLPQDVPIIFKRIKEVNAFYDPQEVNITFGIEMVDNIYSYFEKYYTGQALDDHVMNVIVFILFHEVGHALSDIYDLSVRAPEEDIVDNFSAFLLTTGNAEAEAAAIDGANYFLLSSQKDEERTVSSMPLWDVHALDKKRYFNIISLIYGKDSIKYAGFIRPNMLQKIESPRYHYNYVISVRSWMRDLSPYMHKVED
jgi:hypothetical protein